MVLHPRYSSWAKTHPEYDPFNRLNHPFSSAASSPTVSQNETTAESVADLLEQLRKTGLGGDNTSENMVEE